MIQDTSRLSDLRMDWAGVEALQSSLRRDAIASVAFSLLGGHYPRRLSNAAENLPFLHACSVLNDVLLELSAQGMFNRSYRTLGALVKSSKSALPWRSYRTITKVVNDRNTLAHKGILIDAEKCRINIESIKAELHAWKIVL